MTKFIGEIAGLNISRLRRRAGMTQQDLGKALDTTGRTVHAWEMGSSWPEAETFEHMAVLFRVPVTEFFIPLHKGSECLPTEEHIVAAVAEPGLDVSALRKLKK